MRVPAPKPSIVGSVLTSRPNRTPTPTILSTLLSLVASSKPSSHSRTRLSSLLSAQLLRPAGVRSLFLVVVGVGAAGGGDDEVNVQKLEMVRRVLETPPAGGDGEVSANAGQLPPDA